MIKGLDLFCKGISSQNQKRQIKKSNQDGVSFIILFIIYYFSLAETSAAPRAEQQPAPGRLPVPTQHGVSVPGQDVT